jgi:hypothetical protein
MVEFMKYAPHLALFQRFSVAHSLALGSPPTGTLQGTVSALTQPSEIVQRWT